MCIAPVLIAKVLGKYGIKVTIGKDKTVAEAIVATGAKHENTKVEEACIDIEHNIVTTPAYMLAKSIKEVAKGAESMVSEMIRLAQKK